MHAISLNVSFSKVCKVKKGGAWVGYVFCHHIMRKTGWKRILHELYSADQFQSMLHDAWKSNDKKHKGFMVHLMVSNVFTANFIRYDLKYFFSLWQLHMLNFWYMVKQYHYPFFKGPWVHRSSNKVILKQSNPSKQIHTRHLFSWDQCRFGQPTHCMWVS